MSFNISRFRDIESQEYEVEIVTPMFLGGGNPNQAELRAASIKGALRFWWRASCGISNIADMQKKESEIFGSTENKSNLIIKVGGNIVKKKNFLNNHRAFLFRYLTYGIEQDREYFLAKEKFKMELRYPKRLDNEIRTIANIWADYGGTGSKSRNGFGSIKLLNDDNAYKRNLQKNEKSKFTSFSYNSLLMLGKVYGSWEKSLLEVGEAYKEAKTLLNSNKADKKFSDRKLIAKPIGDITDRHSKPYFLHVNKLEDNQYQGQILYMPYEYYDERQRDNYKRACDKMNVYLAQELEVQDDF